MNKNNSVFILVFIIFVLATSSFLFGDVSDSVSYAYPPPTPFRATPTRSSGTSSLPFKVTLPLVQYDRLVVPFVSRSYYVQSVSNTVMFNMGVNVGSDVYNAPGSQDILVILAFGDPSFNALSEYGTTLPRGPDYPFVSTNQILNASKSFVQGYLNGSSTDVDSRVIIALGTTNNGPFVTANHAVAWSQLVKSFSGWIKNPGPGLDYSSRIVAAGANDIEVNFSNSVTAKNWMDAFFNNTSSFSPSIVMYNFGDAGGCPRTGDGTVDVTCNNGWKMSDIWGISWGNNNKVAPIPQMYRTDSAMAQQWSQLALFGVVSRSSYISPLMGIQGALTQFEACEQKKQDPAPCDASLINTPNTGWVQLWYQLNLSGRTSQRPNFLSDIRYTPRQ